MRDDARSDTETGRALLDWYDAHARRLPWRVPPAERQAGRRPDPYAVWLSEVMLQQTTVAAVEGYFRRFLDRWPRVQDLAAAEDYEVMAAWAGLGYYARARNLLKCARVVAGYLDGRFPENLEGLRALPGVGPYTAAAVAAIAFDIPAIVVDGNVERVMARLHAVQTPLPAAKPVLTAHAAALTPELRAGDHAQAVMDLGATICTPRNPACGICPVNGHCAARQLGLAVELPRKAPKKAKPVRRGIVWVAHRDDGAWLLETRPERGLLGGMLGFPCSDWAEEAPEEAPPLDAPWADPGIAVRHTFTHFHLILTLRLARAGEAAVPERGSFRPLRRADLPTLMRKAHDAAASALPEIERRCEEDL